MRKCTPFALAVLIGIGFGHVRCEGAPQDTASGRDNVIRSTVREVLLDMVVRNSHGHLVTDLKPGEVMVYEDGVRQNVRAFRLVAGSEVRIEDEKQTAEVQAAGSKLPGSKPHPPFNPLRAVNVVCLILNDLNPETRAFAFDSARKFVDRELRPNTFIGVFSLDSSGLRPVYPFSNNREDLLKAVKLAAVNQLPSLSLAPAAMLNGLSMSVTGSVVPGAGAMVFADGSNVQDPLGLRGDMGLSTNAGLREIDALIGLVRQLSPLPFQKTVLLLGTGLTRPADQTEYWDSLIHQAAKGSVTFYAMDVYGLGVCQGDANPDCVAHSAMAPSNAMLPYVAALSRSQGPTAIGRPAAAGAQAAPTTSTDTVAAAAVAGANAAHGPPSSSPAAQMMELAHQDDYLRFMVSSGNRQEAIRELAERTGGFLIANTNNTDKLLAHVMEEVDTHYEIAYAPVLEREDGRFRKIEVKLTRPDLRVETRSGYWAVPAAGEGPVTPQEMVGLRALDTEPRPHAFDFLLRAYRFRGASGMARYAIAFEMPLSNLTAAAPDAGNKRRLHASLLALVKDAQGQIVDRVSKEVSSDVAVEQLAAVQASLMTYQHAVNLPPGRYTVEAAVMDHEGNRASTGAEEIDNREQPGIGISDITLVRRLTDLDRPPDAGNPFEYAGKRVLPFVRTDVLAGMQPAFYFVVYPEPGNAAKPEVRVELLKNGRMHAITTPALPPSDTSGAIPILITESGDPGSYEVRVTVAQAGVSAARSLAYTVAGNASAGGRNPASEPLRPSPPKDDIKAPEDVGSVAGQRPSDDRLASFKDKVRRDMTGIPNYTCLETIDRAKRTPPLRDFIPIDKTRLEVSVVGGKEMFARPGAHRFDDKDVTALVTDGLIGSGMFAGLARTLFVKDKGTLRYKGKENLNGNASVLYNFRLTRQESGFNVEVNRRLEPLGFKGSFWFDPATLDLVRLEAHTDALPVDLNVEEAIIRTSYTRTHIGNSDALLPKGSELTVTYLSGATYRNVIAFSDCHEYGSESKIRFDAPSAKPPE
jgi:VWFA-related protein